MKLPRVQFGLRLAFVLTACAALLIYLLPTRPEPQEKVTLTGTVEPARFASFESRSDVRNLTLDECQFPQNPKCILPEMANLRHLVLDGGNLSSGLFRNLHLSKKLESIRVNYWLSSQLGDDFMVHVGKCKSLKSLHIYHSKVTDAGVESISRLPNLEELTIGNRNTTDAAAKSLCNCSSLKFLDLSGTKLTDDGARSLCNCSSLKLLNLSGTKLTDDGTRLLASRLSLQEIWLSYCPVTPGIGESLASSKSLERVFLIDVVVDSDSAKAFAGMPTLKKLAVRGECWTVEDLEILAESESLQELVLDTPTEDDHYWTRLNRSEILDLRKNTTVAEKLRSLPFDYLGGQIRSKQDFLKKLKVSESGTVSKD